MRQQLKRAETEREILKKATAYFARESHALREHREVRLDHSTWITQHRDSFPIVVHCDVLLVSTSGYYGSPSSRAERHQRIRHAVQQVNAESHGIYGRHKVAQVLHDHDDLESRYGNWACPVASARRSSPRRLQPTPRSNRPRTNWLKTSRPTHTT